MFILIKVHIAMKDLYNFSFFTLKQKQIAKTRKANFSTKSGFKYIYHCAQRYEMVFFLWNPVDV